MRPFGVRNLALVVGSALALATAMVIDVALLGDPTPFVMSCLVVAVAVAALTLASPVLSAVAAVASLVVTVIFAARGGIAFASLSEMGTMLVLLGHWCRRATSLPEAMVTSTLALAILAMPLRAGALSPIWFFLALVAVFVSFAVGRALNNVDGRRARAVTRTRVEERERISRELHDIVAYHVTGILVAAQAARLDDDLPRVHAALAQIEEASAGALAATRELVTTLRDDSSERGGPNSTLEDVVELVERFRDSGSAEQVTAKLPPRIVDPLVATTVHRVIREALTNARRYAFGTEWLAITVEETSEETTVTVADAGGDLANDDDGRARQRLGIVGMRERVEALGGTLHAGPHGHGWRVVARLPRSAHTSGHRTGRTA